MGKQQRKATGEEPGFPVAELGVKSVGDHICCGSVIKPELIKVPTLFRLKLFVALWHCPSCGKISAKYTDEESRSRRA